MSVSKEEIERRMKNFREVCKEKGLKITNQRIEIFSEIAQTEEHPDVETIYNRVIKRMPATSLDTVYRTLWIFSDIGLITPLGPKKERFRFDANMNQHHHFVCTECGFIRDFYEESFNHLNKPDVVDQFGFVKSSHIEFRGLCHRCAQKKQK